MKFKIPVIACIVANSICVLSIFMSQRHYRAILFYAVVLSFLTLIVSFIHYVVIWVWKVRKREEIDLMRTWLGILLMFVVQIPTLIAVLTIITFAGI